MDFDVYAAATYSLPKDKIATTNSVVAKAFDQAVVKTGDALELEQIKLEKVSLQAALDAAIAEIAATSHEEPSKVKQRLMAAQIQDAAVN